MNETADQPRLLVTFWGTRGSIPTPGRLTEKYGGNTACVALECEDTLVVFDAGSGIRPLGVSLARQFEKLRKKRRVHLFLSHTHWDHIQGLPFFTPAYLPQTELLIYSGPSKAALLKEILGGQMDLNYFPVEMSVFGADLEFVELSSEPLQIGPLTIDWQEQWYHSGGSVRFRVTAGERKLIYSTDVEIDRMFEHGVSQSAEKDRHRQEYLQFIEGASLLVGDGQYTFEEYQGKRGWGHSSLEVLLDAARKAGVKQVAAFHHDPERSDNRLDALYTTYSHVLQDAGSTMKFFFAREGMTLAL